MDDRIDPQSPVTLRDLIACAEARFSYKAKVLFWWLIGRPVHHSASSWLWPVRLAALGSALATVAGGFLLRQADLGPVSDHGGTVGYAAMVYFGLLAVRPITAWPINAMVATVVCWCVEVFQLTGWSTQWAQVVPLVRLVLGVAFAWPDMVWYPAGAALAMGVHWAARRMP